MISQLTSCVMLAVTILFSLAVFAPQENQFTPKSLRAALMSRPHGAEAEKLAEQVRAWFGKEIAEKLRRNRSASSCRTAKTI